MVEPTSLFIGDTAYSTYEGGILSVNHRLSNTFSMFANYTWSKCLDVEDNQGDVSGFTGENPANPQRTTVRAARITGSWANVDCCHE
jgi:hypothetical protein